MRTERKYWKGLEELHETPAFKESVENEFPKELSVDEFLSDDKLKESSTGRRDFLKFLGFSVAAAAVAACEAPVIRAVPYVNKPEDVIPGMPTWYASTYYDGMTYASILVKTREGRPIHIKGNKERGFTQGGVNPRVVASVLDLYNSERLQAPYVNGEAKTWEEADEALKNAVKGSKDIVLLTNTVISPSTSLAMDQFAKAMGTTIFQGMEMEEAPADEAHVEADGIVANHAEGEEAHADVIAAPVSNEAFPPAAKSLGNAKVRWIQYDAVSYSGIRKANKESFGKAVIPTYDFSKAKTVVGISCDFQSTWLMGNQYAVDFGKTRNPEGEWMSKHFQFESLMSITGSNADYRGLIKPSQQGAVAAYLYEKVVGGSAGVNTSDLDATTLSYLDKAAEELKKNAGESLVVAGSNDKNVQVIVNAINAKLGNYKSTISLDNTVNLFNGDDEKANAFINGVIDGSESADCVFFYDVNPVYTHPRGAELKEALSKVATSVSFSTYMDETASACKFVMTDNHSLEKWNDFNPREDYYSLAQPTIRPLYDTRDAQETFLVLSGMERGGRDSRTYYDFIRGTWMKWGYPGEKDHFADFESFWGRMVYDSCPVENMMKPSSGVSFNGNVSAAGKAIAAQPTGEWEVQLYQKAAIGDGAQAGNPWLQEMPDMISKVTWDNYITMAPSDVETGGYNSYVDQEHGLTMATLTVNGTELKLPVYPSPGQMPGTLGVAMGYGRGENGEAIGKAAYHTKMYGGHEEGDNGGKKKIGENAFKLLSAEGAALYNFAGEISKSGEEYLIGATQIHHTVMGRNSIIRETTFDFYKSHDDSAGYNHEHVLHTHDGPVPVSDVDLWEAHPVENVGHRWGMSIDLSSCIGCGSCLISCQSENNVPVVGKDEVRRGREMHWLRIDRYYASDMEAAPGTRKEGWDFGGMEKPSASPKVVHMPMMCHHCNHAPCETVCPVAATTHSNEGMNQMAYNRCIGTRYCANNCPYKVRRFNWFNYPSYKKFTQVNPSQDETSRMVLNPDVVVRTRGVMEKCSFCVQKIQAGKLEAKKAGRPVVDGDVTTACSEVCPTNAITVGDWNDKDSAIRKIADHKRSYQALEEVGIRPNIWYQVKVRNDENEDLTIIQTEAEKEAHHHAGGHGDHAEEGGHTEGGHGEGHGEH
ncbi:MAG: TAT-variant-translocated molybdopterin oxidoreductase [Crocinitomicaceae bacterium]|nr:TAT-variant-translocated molybdopterin oxidoreductase [Crocinitomicaceae bacterium]